MAQNKIFTKKYKKYKDKIYNYFWYRVNFNQEIAEDLCSEAFLRAFDKFDVFNLEKKFQPWIYAIAKNCLLNYYRTLGREINLDFAENIKFEEKARIEAKIEIDKIIGLINTFDKYSREVLLFKFADHLTNAEIARILKKDERAIRTQISRALVVLRKKIKQT